MLNCNRRGPLHYQPDTGPAPGRIARARVATPKNSNRYKVGGQHLMFESAYPASSAGFGSATTSVSFAGPIAGLLDTQSGFRRHGGRTDGRQWVVFFRWGVLDHPRGLPLEAAYNTNTHITLRTIGVSRGGAIGPACFPYDDRASRGWTTTVRTAPYIAPWIFIKATTAFAPEHDANWLVPRRRPQRRGMSDSRLQGQRAIPGSGVSRHRSLAATGQFYGQFSDVLGTTTRSPISIRHEPRQHAPPNYTFRRRFGPERATQPFIVRARTATSPTFPTPRAAVRRPLRPSTTPASRAIGSLQPQAFQCNPCSAGYKPGSTPSRSGTRTQVHPIEEHRELQGDVRHLMITAQRAFW